MVIPEISFIEPKRLDDEVIANVIAVVHVAPVQSMLAPRRGMSTVTVFDVPNAQFMNTLSCGSGTREVQLAAVDHDPPFTFVHC